MQTLALSSPRPSRLARLLRHVLDAWLRWRQARLQRRTAAATRAMLQHLDDRTLHDLGFHRSEIGSVSAELAGLARVDRRQR